MTTFETKFSPYNLPLHGVRLPAITISDEQKRKMGLTSDSSNYDFLKALAEEGFNKIVKHPKGSDEYKQYRDRLDYELKTFEELGFIDYLLMTWDVIRFCRESDIATSNGRGSCCGSVLLYFIDVTKIDSVKHSLYFERFVSKTRAKKTIVDGITYLDGSLLMDVDLDISYKDRSKVIEYVNRKYEGRTSKMLTLNTLSGKLLIKEVGKIAGSKSEDEMNSVSDMIPKVHGIVADISDAYEEKLDFKNWCDKNPDVYQIALKLRDLIKNKGSHASGYIISHDLASDSFPMELTSDKELISTYDMNWMSLICVKLDLLGLRAASLVHDICKDLGISSNDIDLSDKLIYDNLQCLKTPHGLFQIEADTNYRVTKDVKPKSLEELTAVLSIARPGAVAYTSQYAKYTSTGEFQSIHPFFDEYLKPTGGLCLYQEQLMQLIAAVGFTLEEAEQIRRCVTKDTLFVSKQRGWISIQELISTGYENDDFLCMDEYGVQSWNKIDKIWLSGVKQTEYVETRNGMRVKATEWHQFLTEKGWKAKKYLNINDDYILCAKEVEFEGKDTLNSDWYIVLAGLITEGYFVKEQNMATFTNWDEELMSKFVKSFIRIFGNDKIRLSSDGRVARILSQEKKEISRVLFAGKSNIKKMPKEMMRASYGAMKEFIGFMYSCEGGVSGRNLCFSSASRQLIHQMQLLLLRYKLKSYVGTKFNKKYQKNYYELIISNAEDRTLFLSIFGDHLSKAKRNDLIKSLDQYGCLAKGFTVDIIPKYLVQKFASQYGRVFCHKSGRFYKNNISRKNFKKFSKESGDYYWKLLANGKQQYSIIKNTKKLYDRSCDVYDFSMKDETRPYIIANGMVIHNCVGKKKIEEMKTWEKKIKAKIKESGIEESAGDALWKIANDSVGYSFNKCVFEDENVELQNGQKNKLKNSKIGDIIKALDIKTGKDIFVKIINKYYNKKSLVEVELYSGNKIRTSLDHKFLCEDLKMRPLREIILNDLSVAYSN